MIALLLSRDQQGNQWRLALDDVPDHPLIVLERTDTVQGKLTWVHVRHVTADTEAAGVKRHGDGIIVLDEDKCRQLMEHELERQGVKLGDFSVLEFAFNLEANAATADSACARAARKLREAFYLMQDLSRVVMALKDRSQMDELPADEIAADQLQDLKGWLSVIELRCAQFITMAPAPLLPTESARWERKFPGHPVPITRPIGRAAALRVARAAAVKHAADHESQKWPPEWVITAIVEASR